MKGMVRFTKRELRHIKRKLGTYHLSVAMDHYNWFQHKGKVKHLNKAIQSLTDLTVDSPDKTNK